MKFETINKKSDFYKLRKKGRCLGNRYLRLYILSGENSNKITKIGFGISKKIGGAVIRNRLKRVLREILRQVTILIPCGTKLFLIANKEITGASFWEIKEQLEKTLSSYFTSA